eukprot:2667265-Rhodomonas_salina.2
MPLKKRRLACCWMQRRELATTEVSSTLLDRSNAASSSQPASAPNSPSTSAPPSPFSASDSEVSFVSRGNAACETLPTSFWDASRARRPACTLATTFANPSSCPDTPTARSSASSSDLTQSARDAPGARFR